MKKVFCTLLIVAIVVSSIPGVTFAAQSQDSTLRTVWENPYTLTSYHQSNEVNSTFFTFPKVIWNGSQYVDYIFNSSDMSAGIGSVYVKVLPDHTIFYDPYQTEERIGRETWTVEYCNISSSVWEADHSVCESVRTLSNSSGIYFDRTTTLNSGARLEEWYWLRIGSKLKITVALHCAQAAQYRLIWLLNGVSGAKARWLATTEDVSSQMMYDKSCSRVQFAADNESKCLVDWSDALIFNETINDWITCFQKLELQRDISGKKCDTRVSFGDFFLDKGQCLALDPTVVTINSTFTRDGFIQKSGDSYPPADQMVVDTSSGELYVGQWMESRYILTRSYLSFDTKTIPTLAYDINVTLRLKKCQDHSYFDFITQIMGGNQPVFNGNLTILNFIQPIYNESLTTSSWDTGKVQVAAWNTSDFGAANEYVNFTIPSNQICKTNETEFELKSNREGTRPSDAYPEYVRFYSGDSAGNEPRLEVSYCLDTMTLGGETWFYRNVSSTRAAIVFFGGRAGGLFSIDCYVGTDHLEKELGKTMFLDAIIQNCCSVFTPSNGTPPDSPYWSSYNETSTWVQDLATWLVDSQSYLKVDLFGFSMGGAIVGYEIQKDYACIYSAAVISEAPVYMAGWGPIFNTALTASEAKVATSFMETPNATPNVPPYFYEMKLYYNNAIVQKEWHNWTGGHGELFRGLNCAEHTCSWPSGENISTAALMWFNTAHPLSAPFTPSGPQLGFAHNTFNYTTRGFQSDGGNLTYQFDWNDGTTTTVGPYVSGTNVTCSHCWTAVPTGQYHTYYNVTARVRDASQNWSANSTPLTVHIKLDDGGCGGDAGDTFGNASPYNSACSLGTVMTYPNYDDVEDWYKFQANSEDTITLDETHLDQICVFLGLYNPSGTLVASLYNNETIPQNISCTADTDGWWRARIYVWWGVGHLYTFHISVTGGGGGGGCPYIYAWNGSSYVKDNSILPASETGNGTDTKDSYKLEQPLVPLFRTRQASLYTLQIREFENEHDYIDQVKLTAVDHSQNTSVAVTTEGEIVTYQNPASPLSCVDNNGNSQLIKIRNMDGNVSDSATYFQGCQGDWLLLDFGNVTATTANLILRDDWKCMDVCIEVQIPNGNGDWRTVEVLHPRNFWAIEAVNMSAYLPANGNLLVRLFWTSTHRLDYVGLDTSAPAQTTIATASPALAIHSTTGDVTGKLLLDDENCVELVNGQQITMVFILPNEAQDTTRDFVLYTNGYYYTITQ